MEGVSFRVASLVDLRALAELRWQFFREEHGTDPGETFAEFLTRFERFLQDALATGRWTIWVAERGAELIGNAWIYAVPKVPRPERDTRAIGYVTNVYVVPGVRGQGVGSALMGAAVEWSRSQLFETLIVWPSSRSRTLYTRAGFVPSPELMEREVLGYEE